MSAPITPQGGSRLDPPSFVPRDTPQPSQELLSMATQCSQSTSLVPIAHRSTPPPSQQGFRHGILRKARKTLGAPNSRWGPHNPFPPAQNPVGFPVLHKQLFSMQGGWAASPTLLLQLHLVIIKGSAPSRHQPAPQKHLVLRPLHFQNSRHSWSLVGILSEGDRGKRDRPNPLGMQLEESKIPHFQRGCKGKGKKRKPS